MGWGACGRLSRQEKWTSELGSSPAVRGGTTLTSWEAFQAFSHPGTNQAPSCLASETRLDWACSGWYGRRLRHFVMWHLATVMCAVGGPCFPIMGYEEGGE